MAVATGQSEHQHLFKVKYKRGAGGMLLIHPVCQCSGCEQKAVIECVADRVSVTFIGDGRDISYTAVLIGENER